MTKKKYLRCELLRPGDVVLSTSRTGTGKGLALMASSPLSSVRFSHAAVCWNQSYLFESNEALLVRPLIVAKAGFPPAPLADLRLSLLHDVSEFRSVGVYRHRSFPAGLPIQKLSLLDSLVQQYLSWEYPNYRRLAKAAAKSVIGRTVSAFGLRLLDEWNAAFGERVDEKDTGPFCSMLVALLYQKVAPEAPLFVPRIDPDEVSPTSLAENSELVSIDAVVTEPLDFESDEHLVQRLNRGLLPDYRDGVSLERAIQLDRDRRLKMVGIRTAGRRGLRESVKHSESLSAYARFLDKVIDHRQRPTEDANATRERGHTPTRTRRSMSSTPSDQTPL